MLAIRRSVLAAMLSLALAACGGQKEAEAPAAPAAAPEAAVRVFAASSLTDVLKTIGDAYAAKGHPAPSLSFAASSDLARQIEQGAEADMFLSADEQWMDYLAEKNLIDPATRASLLTNKLVLIAPADRPITLEIKDGMNLKAALKGGTLVIANPDGVPAGKYAKEALEHFKAWAGVEKDTARAESVRAALRFVETGEAAAGIVYATDAKAAGDKVVTVGEFPADSHTPITYPAAIVAGKAGGPAKGFREYLSSEEAKAAFAAAGFGVSP
ncbi:MAG TPA: molybdate ABC transporter substrate-binding protein [Hyphomonadaceae bacterium]|jgi:molybdate transport system substrate-binding protein|nr:molybdate ABC transporter substrate-binding protein [Hyphomonadaceae bacterium]